MAKMKQLTAQPLAGYSHEWKPLPQHLVEIPPTAPASSAPDGMVSIPGGDYLFKVEGIEIEGDDDIAVDVQYPWEDSARRFHEHRMQIKPFYIDKYPVTNAAFKKFLDASHYHPTDDLNFLKDWKNGAYPDGAANKPVTWVSLEDARAYAKWAGKRLPHEWEWQFAAQGTDNRIFPWGECDWLASANSGGPFACPWQKDPADAPAPVPDKGRVMAASSDVDAHPHGASPFGVVDMVATSGSGPTSTSTITPEPRSSAAAATISRKARTGTSRRHTATRNTANSCSWVPATTAPAPWASAA